MRHVLVVSHFFPPMGGGGVQRVTKMVKYLEECGWRATVVCGRPEDYWMRDDTLVADVPASARVVRVGGASGLGVLRRVGGRGGRGGRGRRAAGTAGATAAATVAPAARRSARLFAVLRRATAWTLVPDSYVGWRAFARRAALETLRADPADAILSSSPPETNHLVGLDLHHATGLPWLVDFRDPWFALHLHPAPTAWHRARHAALERRVLRTAAACTVTTTWLRDLVRRQAGAGAGLLARLHVIRNGFDPADFAAAGAPAPMAPPAPLTLLHTGMLTLTRSAAGLLHGLQHLHAQQPATRGRIHVTFLGARESDNDAQIAKLGLGDCVRMRDYVPHADAIAAMRAADVLLLIKHTAPRFTGLIPGKLYEYMGADRPILALVPPSEAADLVRGLDWGEVAPPDDATAIAAALAKLLAHHDAGTLGQAYARRSRERFDRRTQAHDLAALLAQITTAPAPATSREART